MWRPLQITAEGAAISVLVREQDGAIATPPQNEDEQELVEIDSAIQGFLDEIAVLVETYCEECPRTQERITQEALIARRRLRIVALKWRRKELVKEMKASQRR